MKVQIKRVAVISVTVLVLFSSSMAYAEGRRGFWNKGFGGEQEGGRAEKAERFVEELGLTPEQQELLRAQRQKNKEKASELHQQLRAKRSELQAELEKADVDKRRVYSLVSEIETLMGDQLEQRVERILAMRQILTPEQFARMQEKKKGKCESCHGRFEEKDQKRHRW